MFKYIYLKTVCDSGTYGNACSQNCSCVKDNTDLCNTTDGACTCNTGWDGATCSDNVNECLDNTTCPVLSTCNDNNGSFTCVCEKGYILSSNNTCTGKFSGY